jgi:creatinine amidohydrolase/Fe(II)-dependent formamide hydrolase-like protein
MTGPVLRDIHLPAAHWWPPAPGWWLLAALLLLVVVAAAWWFRRFARNASLRAAMREIDALEAARAHGGNNAQLAEGASRLMRRVALRVAPAVAAQTGEAWRAFVDRHARDENTHCVLGQLIDERFRTRPELDPEALLTALRIWCRDALRGRVARDADDVRVGGKAVRA